MRPISKRWHPRIAFGLLLILIVAYVLIEIATLAPLGNKIVLPPVDHRHASLSWAQIDGLATPWGDPSLLDPGSSVVRLALLIPNSILFLVRHVLDANQTWLAAITVGWIAFILVGGWLFFLDSGSTTISLVASLLLAIFGTMLQSLPPLSLNQLRATVDGLLLPGVGTAAQGFYGFSVEYFSIPYFFLTVGCTLWLFHGGKRYWLKAALWSLLCVLLPLVYFYHWLQYGALLPVIVAALYYTGRINRQDIIRFVRGPLPIVLAGWLLYFVAQNALVNSVSGREYMLSIGLQEARYIRVEWPTILRALLFLAVTLIFLRPLLRKSVVYWIGLGIYIEALGLQNIQILVGKTIQPTHFDFLNTAAVPLALLSIVIYAWQNLHWRWLATLRRASLALLILLAVAVGYFEIGALASWKAFAKSATADSDMLDLLDYFRSHPSLKVILTDDTDLEATLIFADSLHSYLPWDALSTVTPQERMQRAVDGWRLLYNPRDIDFGKWLSGKSWQLFHMKYGTSPDFSSTLWYDPETQPQVVAFTERGILPTQEQAVYSQVKQQGAISFRLDAVIFHSADTIPDCIKPQPVLFKNPSYRVFAAPTTC